MLACVCPLFYKLIQKAIKFVQRDLFFNKETQWSHSWSLLRAQAAASTRFLFGEYPLGSLFWPGGCSLGPSCTENACYLEGGADNLSVWYLKARWQVSSVNIWAIGANFHLILNIQRLVTAHEAHISRVGILKASVWLWTLYIIGFHPLV